MTLLIKPRTLGLLTKIERRPVGASYIVSAFGLFNLADPDPYRLQSDQAMWLLVAKEMPPGAIFDIGMPKPTAEVLVAGHAVAPNGEPVQRMGLAWALGGLQKQLLVTGDRHWRMAGATAVPTEPAPFTQMPLTPARSFGGEGHPVNPAGAGFRAQERMMGQELVALPNIEVPEQAIRSIGDAPPPARFGPLAIDAKERLQFAGTYDDAWMTTRAPALADDADPHLFLFAPQDQRLPRHLDGDEAYGLRNFSADAPEVQQRLPGFRVRCFIGWTDPQKAVVELPMRIDTLWLFAGSRRGVMVYRGATPVEDIEAADVADVMIAYERMADAPLPLSHYLQIRALRTNPETAFKQAFAEHQLTPKQPQELLDARRAKRVALAAERRRRQRENTQWLMQRELERSEIPRELWPTLDIPEPEDDGLLLPLPEELAAGEVDLGELLDSIDEIQRTQEAKLDALMQARQPVLDAMSEIASGTAEPDAIDRLLALLEQPDMAAQIDSEIANLPSDATLAALPPSAELDEALKALDSAKDWRGTMLAAASPKVDEDAQLRAAQARFLGLPEGRPLEHVRNLLASEQLAFPELPALPPSQAAPGDAAEFVADLDEALLALESSPHAPPEAANQLKSAIADADAKLAGVFPALAADGASPLKALLALLARPGPGKPPPADPQQALADARIAVQQGIDAAGTGIDQAEAQLVEGLAAIRLASPRPLKPDVPLTPAVAHALGDLVVQQFGAGLVLARRDFAGADLSGRDLSGADLTGAFLENANLDNARLDGALLGKATLAGASLRGADLSRCDLTGANLGAVNGAGARFDGARLIDTQLLGASFVGASFAGAELSNLILMQTPFAGASFAAARLSDLIMMRCQLPDSDWRGVQLQRVQLVDCGLERARFTGAMLHEVSFLLAKAEQADFSEARLSSVAFAGDVDLRQSRFDDVVATGLTFQKSALDGANFSRGRFERLCLVATALPRANFRLASLKRSLFSRNDLTGTDFFGADLLEAQFNRADLSGASLRAANLFGADLMDATLLGADFSRANLSRTILAVASHAG